MESRHGLQPLMAPTEQPIRQHLRMTLFESNDQKFLSRPASDLDRRIRCHVAVREIDILCSLLPLSGLLPVYILDSAGCL